MNWPFFLDSIHSSLQKRLISKFPRLFLVDASMKLNHLDMQLINLVLSDLISFDTTHKIFLKVKLAQPTKWFTELGFWVAFSSVDYRGNKFGKAEAHFFISNRFLLFDSTCFQFTGIWVLFSGSPRISPASAAFSTATRGDGCESRFGAPAASRRRKKMKKNKMKMEQDDGGLKKPKKKQGKLWWWWRFIEIERERRNNAGPAVHGMECASFLSLFLSLSLSLSLSLLVSFTALARSETRQWCIGQLENRNANTRAIPRRCRPPRQWQTIQLAIDLRSSLLRLHKSPVDEPSGKRRADNMLIDSAPRCQHAHSTSLSSAIIQNERTEEHQQESHPRGSQGPPAAPNDTRPRTNPINGPQLMIPAHPTLDNSNRWSPLRLQVPTSPAKWPATCFSSLYLPSFTEFSWNS